jgi:hypothetical protein
MFVDELDDGRTENTVEVMQLGTFIVNEQLRSSNFKTKRIIGWPKASNVPLNTPVIF